MTYEPYLHILVVTKGSIDCVSKHDLIIVVIIIIIIIIIISVVYINILTADIFPLLFCSIIIVMTHSTWMMMVKNWASWVY